MNISNELKIYCPLESSIDSFIDFNGLNSQPFSKDIVEFINDFSKALFKNTEVKEFSDLISLAFWMRKQKVKKLLTLFETQNKGKVKIARGIVFHIAPSNVDTIFIYSLFLSMMLGNRNIVRISSKDSARQTILITILNQLFEGKYSHLKNILRIVNYPHDKNTTDYFSSHADARIIWGGDNTINEVSKSLSKPTCVDLKFSNKYSYALIDAASLKDLENDPNAALFTNFVNDAYWFGQQACSSPKTVIWLNAADNMSQIENFWQMVETKAQAFNHGVEAADYINKYIAQQRAAIVSDISIVKNNANILNRVKIKNNSSKLKMLNCGSGLFFEIHLGSLSSLPQLFERNDQTLSYYGLDVKDIKQVLSRSPLGIDRVVPIGTALNFSHIWDGYDFFEQLTRQITFE
jgi:hypothetical protein